MKLLLDQNLSHRLISSLQESFPDSTQVRFLGMDGAVDKEIWDFAQENGYTIVTLDADFHEYSLLWGGPPLIIWLKFGNQPKNIVLEKLLSNRRAIEQAGKDDNIWCVEIY